MLHPYGQYFENTQPHGSAYFTTPLMDHFTGVYCRTRDDSNRGGFFEKGCHYRSERPGRLENRLRNSCKEDHGVTYETHTSHCL